MNEQEARAVIDFFGRDIVVYTDSGTRYHVPNCPMLGRRKRRITFPLNVESLGLTACKFCEPKSHVLYRIAKEATDERPREARMQG